MSAKVTVNDEEKARIEEQKKREVDQAAVDVLNANEYLGYSDWEISYGVNPAVYVDHIFTPSNTFWRIELSAAVALAGTMPKVKPAKK